MAILTFIFDTLFRGLWFLLGCGLLGVLMVACVAEKHGGGDE